VAIDYRVTLRSLLPQGRAWEFEENSNFKKFIYSFAEELSRVTSRALNLYEESNPTTTDELLTDWERVVGLPAGCSGELADTAEKRREDVISRLVATGGQTTEYFKSIAQTQGFNIEFIATGLSLCGGTRLGQRLRAHPGWAYTIEMIVDGSPDDLFRISCIINQIKPAHIYLFTAFQDTFARCGSARSGDPIRRIF
jgi:uncharacterized protein YmfQ (DUF2313 family)